MRTFVHERLIRAVSRVSALISSSFSLSIFDEIKLRTHLLKTHAFEHMAQGDQKNHFYTIEITVNNEFMMIKALAIHLFS